MRIISGKYKGKYITGFDINGTRPTMDRVKESLFGMIQDYISDSSCLDLFAGSGSLGIEALSCGAKECYFVDNNINIINILKKNINTIENAFIIKKDFKNALKEFCNQNNIRFFATNVPRRYARMVSKLGIESLDQLSPLAKSYIAPLPITIDLNEIAYKNMAHDMPSGGGMKSVNPENIAKAQAVKDATMAYFILKNWSKGELFFHFNGEFHSANYSGIVYYLKLYNKNISVKTISIVQQKDIMKLDPENLNRADYIIVIPESMSTTY